MAFPPEQFQISEAPRACWMWHTAGLHNGAATGAAATLTGCGTPQNISVAGSFTEKWRLSFYSLDFFLCS